MNKNWNMINCLFEKQQPIFEVCLEANTDKKEASDGTGY